MFVALLIVIALIALAVVLIGLSRQKSDSSRYTSDASAEWSTLLNSLEVVVATLTDRSNQLRAQSDDLDCINGQLLVFAYAKEITGRAIRAGANDDRAIWLRSEILAPNGLRDLSLADPKALQAIYDGCHRLDRHCTQLVMARDY